MELLVQHLVVNVQHPLFVLESSTLHFDYQLVKPYGILLTPMLGKK